MKQTLVHHDILVLCIKGKKKSNLELWPVALELVQGGIHSTAFWPTYQPLLAASNKSALHFVCSMMLLKVQILVEL